MSLHLILKGLNLACFVLLDYRAITETRLARQVVVLGYLCAPSHFSSVILRLHLAQSLSRFQMSPIQVTSVREFAGLALTAQVLDGSVLPWFHSPAASAR